MLEVANAIAGERATRSRKAKDRPIETLECSGGPRDLPEQADHSAVSWFPLSEQADYEFKYPSSAYRN
eukprot:IDg8787t1